MFKSCGYKQTRLRIPIYMVIDSRHACADCTWLCVCLSVKSHLTSGASVCHKDTVTYSAGNGGQNICEVFAEAAPLQRYTHCTAIHAVGHFGNRAHVFIARAFSPCTAPRVLHLAVQCVYLCNGAASAKTSQIF